MIYWIAAVLGWALIGIFLRYHRIWVFYYIWCAVGFTLMAILVLRSSPMEYKIEQVTGLLLHYVLDYMGIKTYVFDKAPGTILVLLALENSWTCIDIDIECSGLLEACVLLGLLIFYPGVKLGRRLWSGIAGLAALFLINLIRLLTVVLVLSTSGRDSMYIAHTLIGRLVFFFLLIIVYWYIFTRPALSRVRRGTGQ